MGQEGLDQVCVCVCQHLNFNFYVSQSVLLVVVEPRCATWSHNVLLVVVTVSHSVLLVVVTVSHSVLLGATVCYLWS